MNRAATPLAIAQVCHGSLGGSTRVAGRLANALVRRGHGVRVVARVAPPWPLDPAVEMQVLERDNDTAAPFYWDWSEHDLERFTALLADSLTARPVDLLHYHTAQPFAAVISRVSERLGPAMPPVVGTLHGTDLTRCLADAAGPGWLRRHLAATDRLTTVSRHMRHLAERLPAGIAEPEVLPNFIEDDWPGPPRRGGTGRPVLLHVSNIRAVKDLGLLARLFLAIHARTGAELWLAGDGPELPALRQRLAASPAADAVRYFGVRADPETVFAAATLFLSTSVEESFGLAVLEAMAAGTPAVATGVGGIPELVEDDVNGLLFAPDDWQVAADRVVALLAAPSRLAALAAAARRRAADYREAHVVPLYEGLYRQAQRARASSPAV